MFFNMYVCMYVIFLVGVEKKFLDRELSDRKSHLVDNLKEPFFEFTIHKGKLPKIKRKIE